MLSDRSARAARTRESIPPEYRTATLVWPQDSAVMSREGGATEVCNRYQSVLTQISTAMQEFKTTINTNIAAAYYEGSGVGDTAKGCISSHRNDAAVA